MKKLISLITADNNYKGITETTEYKKIELECGKKYTAPDGDFFYVAEDISNLPFSTIFAEVNVEEDQLYKDKMAKMIEVVKIHNHTNLMKLLKYDNRGIWTRKVGSLYWKWAESDMVFDYDEAIKHLMDIKAITEIAEAGKSWPTGTFDYKKMFEFILENDTTGEALLYAGRYWPNRTYDHRRGAARILEIDILGDNIVTAGRFWPEETFNFEDGLDVLIDKVKNAEKIAQSIEEKYDMDKSTIIYRIRDTIISAGEYWPTFNYKKALKALFDATNDIEYIKKAYAIWYCRKGGDFDFEYAYRKIIENDETGRYIALFGGDPNWMPYYNYKEAFNMLVERDKEGIYLVKAGEKWPEYNYKRAIDIISSRRLIDAIIIAGETWKRKHFDYKTGFDIIMQTDKTGEALVYIGKHWPISKVDHEKIIDRLIELGNVKGMEKAIETWSIFKKKYTKGHPEYKKLYKKIINFCM